MWSAIRITLAALNVLGAVAFVALASMDYGKRQTWSHAVLLHDVALNGLPLDKDETDADNRKLAELISESDLKEMFGGQSAATQIDEVKRVHDKLDQAVQAGADKKAQLRGLARVLTPLAVSETQRENLASIQAYLADPKSADQLKADVTRAALAAKDQAAKPPQPFEAAFAEELETQPGVSRRPFEEAYLVEQKKSPGKKPEELFEDSLEQMRQNLRAAFDQAFAPALTGKLDGKDVAPSERKALIATLLFNLTEPMGELETQQAAKPGVGYDLAQGPYKRYLTVVGLEAAVRAVRREAVILSQMSDDLRMEMYRDRTRFVTAHEELVNQMRLAASKEAELSDALARQKDLLAKQQALLARRKEDVKLFEAELAKLNKETADRLGEVRKMDDELFKVRVATRNASEANRKSEQKIRSLEEGK
jgi:hypothetical protein